MTVASKISLPSRYVEDKGTLVLLPCPGSSYDPVPKPWSPAMLGGMGTSTQKMC